MEPQRATNRPIYKKQLVCNIIFLFVGILLILWPILIFVGVYQLAGYGAYDEGLKSQFRYNEYVYSNCTNMEWTSDYPDCYNGLTIKDYIILNGECWNRYKSSENNDIVERCHFEFNNGTHFSEMYGPINIWCNWHQRFIFCDGSIEQIMNCYGDFKKAYIPMKYYFDGKTCMLEPFKPSYAYGWLFLLGFGIFISYLGICFACTTCSLMKAELRDRTLAENNPLIVNADHKNKADTSLVYVH